MHSGTTLTILLNLAAGVVVAIEDFAGTVFLAIVGVSEKLGPLQDIQWHMVEGIGGAYLVLSQKLMFRCRALRDLNDDRTGRLD